MSRNRLTLSGIVAAGLLFWQTAQCQESQAPVPSDSGKSNNSLQSSRADSAKSSQVNTVQNTADTAAKSQVDTAIKSSRAEPEKSAPVSQTVTGTVTNAKTNNPLAGVSVTVKNSSTKSVSDENGKYSIDVTGEKDVLIFFLSGYFTQEILVENKIVIHVALEETIQELDKLVVIGYGTSKKRDLTGSVSAVDFKDIQKSVGTNIGQMLQGKAAGVQIAQNSGAPGKALTVRIRGIGTVNNSNPLYVVDGQPITDISYLNPEDVESISVLKDASATAIYGSRGANGVILITTRKGKAGKSEITYDGYIGWQNPVKKPDMCTAEEWAMLNNEAYRAANLPVQQGLENPSSLGTGTNWFDLVTHKNALIQDQNVSISRGGDKLRYFLSGGYFAQEGIIEGSDYRKISIRLNTEDQISDWFAIGDNLGFSNIKRNNTDETDEWNSLISSALSIDPVSKPRDPGGSLVSSRYTQVKNPVGIIEHTYNTDKDNLLVGNIYATIKAGNLITYKSDFGINLAYLDKYQFYPTYDLGPDDNVELSTVRRQNNRNFLWNWENTAVIAKTLAQNHNLKLTIGSTMNRAREEIMTAENQGTPGNDQSQQWLNSTMSTNGIVTGVGTGNALLSYLGRLDWNYAEKYFLSGTFRSDGSSRFGPSNRWGVFPSGTAAWRISQEPFMENVSFVKELKLRYGYGKTGNQEIGNFLYVTTTANGQNYVFNSEVSNGATFLTNGTRGITWESQITHDAGLDAELFKGRVEFTGDYFYKKTYGMLTQPTIPGCVGLKTPPMENLGDVRNRGFEFVLGYNGGKKDFSTDLSLNFTTYENTVMSLGNHNEPIVDVLARERAYVVKTAVGKPVGSFYGYKTNGLFQNMNEVNSYKKANGGLIQPNAKPGDIRYVADSNGDFVKDYIGDPNPDFIFGFTADFTVKNFDLNLFFQGSYGNDIFNAARFTTDDNTAYFSLDRRMLDRWTGEGTTNDPNLARMNVNGADNLLVSDRYVEDGSYVRLKTIQLGYSLPKSFVERIGLAKFRIYVGAQNLFTITRYKGLDPEIGQGEDGNSANRFLDIGIDRGTYPQARTIVTGINLSF